MSAPGPRHALARAPARRSARRLPLCRLFARLRASTRGASTVEFAILAPTLMLMIFGIIETSRAYWTKDALQEASYYTARCASLAATGCTTTAAMQQTAVSRLARSGLTITTANVTATSATTCGGLSNMVSITVTSPFNTPVASMLPMVPRTLRATTCLPMM